MYSLSSLMSDQLIIKNKMIYISDDIYVEVINKSFRFFLSVLTKSNVSLLEYNTSIENFFPLQLVSIVL